LTYTSNICENVGIGGGIAPLSPIAMRLVATIFWLQATDQRRNSWLSVVHVQTDSVIQI